MLPAYVLMGRKVLGLRIRAVGENVAAASYAGIPLLPSMPIVGALSGGLAGLAGTSEVAGLDGFLTADPSHGFGRAGIVVPVLAGFQPLAVIAAAILVAGSLSVSTQ